VNFNTEIWIDPPKVWRLDGKDNVVVIIALEEGPLRIDYEAFFPGKTVTTGDPHPLVVYTCSIGGIIGRVLTSPCLPPVSMGRVLTSLKEAHFPPSP
jgi:hypothetical protein